MTLPEGVSADVELPGSPSQTIETAGTSTLRSQIPQGVSA